MELKYEELREIYIVKPESLSELLELQRLAEDMAALSSQTPEEWIAFALRARAVSQAYTACNDPYAELHEEQGRQLVRRILRGSQNDNA